MTSGEVAALAADRQVYLQNDCVDTNATVHPLATEICDELDNDCDGSTDEGVQTTFYQDADGDSYGNAAVTTGACSVPTGWTGDANDCVDTNARQTPITTRYLDADSDGYSPGTTTVSCADT